MEEMDITETILDPDKSDPAFYVWVGETESVWGIESNPFFVIRNGEMRFRFKDSYGREVIVRYTNQLEDIEIETDSQLQEAEQLGKIETIDNAWFEVWAVGSDYVSEPIFDVFEALELAKKLGKQFPDGDPKY